MMLDAHMPTPNRLQRQVDFSFLLAVYNEERQLVESVSTLHRFLVANAHYSFEIFLCDDGSTDGTAQIAATVSAQHPEVVRLVSYQRNRGRGHALKYAERYLRGRYVVYLDLDMCKDARLGKVVAPIVEGLHTHDIVIASRFMKASHSTRKPVRRAVSAIYRSIVHVVFPGLAVTDTDVGCKGIRRDVFSRLNNLATLDRWSYDLQMLVHAREQGCRILEFPQHWNERLDPYSTVRIVKDSLEQLHGIVHVKLGEIRRKIQHGHRASAKANATGTATSRSNGMTNR